MRFELFVALRYLFARRKQAFIYIISAMSVLGVAIGVAALVVVLGVYNGFTTDIRDKILGANAHIIVSGPLAALTAPPSDADFEKMRGGEAPELSGMAAVLRRINATPGVVGSTPFLYAEGMLSSPRGVKGVVLRGIDPKTAPDVLTMLDNLSSGSVADLNASVEGAPPGVKEPLDLTKPNPDVKVPYLKNPAGDIIQPIFSDLWEFEKFRQKNPRKLQALAAPFQKLVPPLIQNAKGFALNPAGFNLLLQRDKVEALAKQQ